MFSHILSTYFVSPEWRLNLGFGTHKKCPFPLNRGVPEKEVTITVVMWTFYRDQILWPLNGGVPLIEVSQRKGSTVSLTCMLNTWTQNLFEYDLQNVVKRDFLSTSENHWGTQSKLVVNSHLLCSVIVTLSSNITNKSGAPNENMVQNQLNIA